MNGFDIACLVYIGVVVAVGYWRGFLYQLMTLLALLLSLFLSIYAAAPLTKLAAGNELLNEIHTYYLVRLVSAGVIYCILGVFIWYFDSKMRKSGVRESSVNRLAGALFGGMKGGLIVAAILFGMSFIAASALVKRAPSLNRSLFLHLVREHNPFPHEVIVENLQQALKIVAAPEGTAHLEAILKRHGMATKEYLEQLKTRRIMPLIRDNYFRKLLSEKGAFQ